MTVFDKWGRLPQKFPAEFTAGVCALIVVLTWLVYRQTFTYTYLDWDDNTLVEQNITVTDPAWQWTRDIYVPHKVPGPHLPLRSTSYKFDLHVLGKNASAVVKANYHHVTNAWLYALNGILLYFVMRRLLNPWAAAIGSLIWMA